MNFWPKSGIDTAQMTIVRTLSKTIRVVADNSFVTDMPAKLKNAMLKQMINITVVYHYLLFIIIVYYYYYYAKVSQT